MSIEIIPAGASAVVTEHNHGSKHPDRWDLSTEMQRDLNHTRSQAEKEFIELTNQAERNVARVVDEQSDDTAEIKSSVEESATADALASSLSDYRSQRSFFDGQKQVSDSATATVVGFKDAATTAYQLQGQSLLEAAKNAAALSVQSQKQSDGLSNQAINNFNLSAISRESNFNSLTVQGNLMQYNVLLDSQKNAAASALLATQIAAAQAAAAAECCCELKEKIGDDGQKTRDLINSVTQQDLRDRAMRSESALAAYFAGRVAPVVPVV